jgi:hypothetical protein
MLESMRYRWTPKDAKGIALAAALLAAFASYGLWRIFSSGATVRGVVISTGPVGVSKACGANRQVASVQLSDGSVVYASADFVSPLLPGAQVSLQKVWSQCDPVTYVVLALN